MEYKRYDINKNIIQPVPVNLLSGFVQRTIKMATLKLGLVLAYLIGLPLWVLAFITNIDSWKSAVLFILMVIYWGGMIWFSFRKKARLEKKEELELWHLEQDKKDRENNNYK